MKSFVVLCLIVCMVGGCTTLHPIVNAPSDLSQHFSDGGVLQPGDRVIITTVAGARRHLRIRSVTRYHFPRLPPSTGEISAQRRRPFWWS
jgi:hypothetical protein